MAETFSRRLVGLGWGNRVNDLSRTGGRSDTWEQRRGVEGGAYGVRVL